MIYLNMADEVDEFNNFSDENFNFSENTLHFSDMDRTEPPIPVKGPPSGEYQPLVIQPSGTRSNDVMDEVVPSIPVGPPSVNFQLPINTGDIFQGLQMSLDESDFIEISLKDESDLENESVMEDVSDMEDDTGIWDETSIGDDAKHAAENSLEDVVKNGMENAASLENETGSLVEDPANLKDDVSLAVKNGMEDEADNSEEDEVNLAVENREDEASAVIETMDDEAQRTALSLRSSMGNAYYLDGPSTDPETVDDLGNFGRPYSYRTENFNAEPESHIQEITLERGSVFTALSTLYKQKKYRYLPLDEIKYVFKGEPAEGLGPTKQALTLYHIEGKDLFYEGDSEYIPRTSGEQSEALGRVLYHTFRFTGGFPSFICKAFIFKLLTGRDVKLYDEECLMKSYINFSLISGDDKLILLSAVNEGLQNMSGEAKSKLFEVISHEKNIKLAQNIGTSYLRNVSIDETNWRQVFIGLAHLDMIEKPACVSVAREFQLCMGELYSRYEAIDIINKMNPTPQSIIDMLETQDSPLTITQDEKKVYSYVPKFIMYHCNEPKMAERFMMYCTASTNLPSEPIIVGFNSVSGLARAVTAYTCANMIELPTTYESYEDFEDEFMKTLTNNESFIFTSV